MSALCREFGISRVTGDKLFNRYKAFGLDGLQDRSRRPYRHANTLPFQIAQAILAIKRGYTTWGAPKTREKLIREYPMLTPPANSRLPAVLDRNGLVKSRKRHRYQAEDTERREAYTPNGLWCADYKGEFMPGNKPYCYPLYPLTITDYQSRYLLACEGLGSTKSSLAFAVFERAFKDYGLSGAIRTDNGVPFASPNAFFGLNRLSLWWLRLGSDIQRIKPGNLQQSGHHEPMHLTLKKAATKPASFNCLPQQQRFDTFQGGLQQ